MPASSPPALPAGYDPGNGSVKLIIDGAEVLMPSYFAALHNEIYDVIESKQGSLIEYLGGDRADLIGQKWLTGCPAYQINPQGHQRVVDDISRKVKLGLQLLLGALGSLQHCPKWNLSIACSVQDAEVLGSELSKAIAGRHNIRINNKGVTSVEVAVSAVLEEGSGAVVSALASGLIKGQTQNIVLDFGNGTIISSIFAAGRKLIARKVTRGGVDCLIEAIAKNLNTRRQLLKEAHRHLIRVCIENQIFKYGTTTWNFRDVYNAELKPWVVANLATALKSVEAWRDQSDSIIAIGGGSQLPTINTLLGIQNIVTSYDAVWLNCRGLQRLAQIKLRRVA
ncbi:hypothetical protein H6F61_24125 [Cyanobacteria bacterium FACHB-472]|nr:hypothetical protein [Cyanobacteria bacterium FACHB-472]